MGSSASGATIGAPRAIEIEGARFARWIDIDPRKIGRIARGAPIQGPDVLAPGRDFVVVTVGSMRARELVRADLVRRGFVEQHDFVCAA